jgi:NADPH-dependent 2,4-dienoyl-CoA reductase/sulfur reductase-like enzyme
MEIFGSYDVVVAGAGVSGVVAAIRSARMGAKTLLVEGSAVLGGLVTSGRLTKPSGLINGGVFAELLARCAEWDAADPVVRESFWGRYTGTFDSEAMQRAIIETMDEAGVEVLLHAQIVGALTEGGTVRSIDVQTKSGRRRIESRFFVDATGDGDLAVLAGANFMLGHGPEGRLQPMSAYFRVLNVNLPALARDCVAHRDDLSELILPERGESNEDYVMVFLATGFAKRIAVARAEGFPWIIPRDNLTLKAGFIPGELNVNVTRFHGNALDDRVRSRAELEIRRQAYCAFDFLKRYLNGFEKAIFLEVARLGVRETRRIQGEYVLRESDVRTGARFADAIGLCNAPISYHDPNTDKPIMQGVGQGYGIPLRCLVPEGLHGLLLAGRCISVDEIAFSSTRNVPACAITGEAAGTAAAIAVAQGQIRAPLDISAIQIALRGQGVVLGTD